MYSRSRGFWKGEEKPILTILIYVWRIWRYQLMMMTVMKKVFSVCKWCHWPPMLFSRHLMTNEYYRYGEQIDAAACVVRLRVRVCATTTSSAVTLFARSFMCRYLTALNDAALMPWIRCTYGGACVAGFVTSAVAPRCSHISRGNNAMLIGAARLRHVP